MNKVFALRKCLRVPCVTTTRRYAAKEQRCDAHMNELPVPCGPWEDHYRERQSFYMKHLLVGAAWFLFSAAMVFYTDSLYLNWNHPAMPGPPSDMIEACDDSEN